jgi:hypothetical protein
MILLDKVGGGREERERAREGGKEGSREAARGPTFH